MNLDDFKNIDFKEVGSLPLQIKAIIVFAIFAATLAIGYLLVWSPSIETLDQETAKEEDLRKVFLEKKNQAINLTGYKAQVVQIEKTFGVLLKQLPDRAKMDGLLKDINQAGLSKNLEFDLFKPGQETKTEFYAEMPIAIKVVGSYHNLGDFATEISKLSRIVTLNDISITNVPVEAAPAGKEVKAKTSDLLVMEATAKTYRYLDAEEVAAVATAKKKERDAKNKSKKAEKAENGHG